MWKIKTKLTLKRIYRNIVISLLGIKEEVIKDDELMFDGSTRVTNYTSVLNIIKVTLHEEQRDTEGNDFKMFVHVSIIGVPILNWVYRDTYRRKIYIALKEKRKGL